MLNYYLISFAKGYELGFELGFMEAVCQEMTVKCAVTPNRMSKRYTKLIERIHNVPTEVFTYIVLSFYSINSILRRIGQM